MKIFGINFVFSLKIEYGIYDAERPMDFILNLILLLLLLPLKNFIYSYLYFHFFYIILEKERSLAIYIPINTNIEGADFYFYIIFNLKK
jgi:hypothetical protein